MQLFTTTRKCSTLHSTALKEAIFYDADEADTLTSSSTPRLRRAAVVYNNDELLYTSSPDAVRARREAIVYDADEAENSNLIWQGCTELTAMMMSLSRLLPKSSIGNGGRQPSMILWRSSKLPLTGLFARGEQPPSMTIWKMGFC